MRRSFPRDFEAVPADWAPRPTKHLEMCAPRRADEPTHDRDAVIPAHQPIQVSAHIPLPGDPLLPAYFRVELPVAVGAVGRGVMTDSELRVTHDQVVEDDGYAASRRGTGCCRTSGQLAERTRCGALSSPSPDRAVETSWRPELTRPRLPFTQCQSRMRHLVGIPRSIAARTAGQASRVDTKRPRILLEGIRRSEYPTAPSIAMAKPSGDLGRFTSLARLKSNSTRSKSASSYAEGTPAGSVKP